MTSLARLMAAALLCAVPGMAMADDREACHRASGTVAIAACNRVIESGRYSGDDLASAYANRGQEYYVEKQYDRAIDDATQAIRLDAKAAVARVNRANAWSMKRDHDKAIADYTEALKLDPNFTAAYTGRAMDWEAKGNVERAIADYKAALKVPQKHQDGKRAHEQARARLQVLDKKKR